MNPKHQRTYEFRCPVHGFVTLNDWEREIISQPAYQRLRRIRQLAWTDYVYPGAMHTRFEHSLGVMHVATAMFDSLVQSSQELLRREHHFEDAGFERDRILVRLTALLHDVGHAPFSHAAEDLFPEKLDGSGRYEHEEYSAAIIREKLRDVIEKHPSNERNYHIKADEIANLLEGSTDAGGSLIWRDLVTGQMDADRNDYLIRDSLHCGVEYGRFDWKRLNNCLTLVTGDEDRGIRLGVTEGGLHAAESLVLARYFMFTQVYFHKTRVAYDFHLRHALKELLPNGQFPKPEGEGLDEYHTWDDWKVLGMLAGGEGGEHGHRLANRDHYREVYHTRENPNADDILKFEEIRDALDEEMYTIEHASKSWYKIDETDIPIQSENPGQAVIPLSKHSEVVAGLKPIGKRSIFCKPEYSEKAREIIETHTSGGE